MGRLISKVRLALGLLLAVPIGCAGDALPGASDDGVASASSPLVGRHTIRLSLPSEIAPANVVVASKSDVFFGSSARVVPGATTTPVIANVGTGTTRISAGDQITADVVSTAPVTIEYVVKVTGSVHSAGPVTIGQLSTVSGPVRRNTPVPGPRELAWDIVAPAPVGSLTVSSGERPLTPGSYAAVRVTGTATLRLSAGTYYFDVLDLAAPSTKLKIDTSAGPVIVYVGSQLVYGAQTTVTGGVDRFLLTMLGGGIVDLPHPLQGTLIAPNARVHLRAVGPNIGAVFAHGFSTATGVELQHRPSAVLGTLFPNETTCLREVQMLGVGRNGGSSGTPRWFAFAGDRALISTGQGWGSDVSASAMEFGDLDNDGHDEVVVARSRISGPRLIVYDDWKRGFSGDPATVRQIDTSGWGSDFDARSLALGDIDNDGKLEIAVGRSPGGDHQLFLYDDVDTNYRSLRSIRINRGVNDLEFEDVDGDGMEELLLTRSGEGSSTAGRFLVFENLAEGLTSSEFARWPAGQNGGAIAVGNFDGTGAPEIAIGRSAASGRPRIDIYRHDGTTYQLVTTLGSEWNGAEGTTALDFGDLDGDGKDELVVGRNGCCSGSTKVLIYRWASDGVPPTVMASFGQNWGTDRYATRLVIGDFDGDLRQEIAVGRNDGDNDRVILIDDFASGFEGLYTMGRGWGDTRGVTAIAASQEKVCLHKQARPLPETVAEARSRAPERRSDAIIAMLDPFLGELAALPPNTTDWGASFRDGIFGKHDGSGDRVKPGDGLRRVMAGFAALTTSSPGPALASRIATLRSKAFRLNANLWLEGLEFYEDVGTPDDFDFNLMTMMGIVQAFGLTTVSGEPRICDETPANANTERLICRDSLLGLLLYNRFCPLGTADIAPPFGPFFPFCSFPLSGTDPHRTMDEIAPFTSVPETENHVLMINTWSFLLNQWIRDNLRRESPVSDFSAWYSEELDNTDSDLEELLLGYLGRVVQNDVWETNARAYQAFTVRALILLASYARGPVRDGAQNALDFLATKFAFQSHHGRRLTPMRRNWEYRHRPALFENDYIPDIFGVLTGATIGDTSPDCTGLLCRYKAGPFAGFALEAVVATYRVPAIVQDFMLHPDNRVTGWGAWSRMQSRYTEEHHTLNDEARRPGNDNPNPLSTPLEVVPEFYFVTQSYVNSAGGRHEPYEGYPEWRSS
jgi:hypothetical protein